MDYRDLLKRKIDENKNEMIKTLQELAAIKSVAGKPVKTESSNTDMDRAETFPFGEGVQKAFRYMTDKAEAEGFEIENADNYGGHVEFGGYIFDDNGEMTATSSETMGIVCHLDTVPEGSGWSHDPFAGEIEDGKLYGRGTIDDKGPAVAAFFAMKAMKDCGFIPEKKVRLIFGLDEETNWEGMERYLQTFDPPDFGFTPDAEFPAIQGEKGIMDFDIAGKFSRPEGKGLEIRSFRGGQASNMVPENARAVVRSENKAIYDEIREKAEKFREEKGIPVNVRNTGKSLEIQMKGVSAHGSKPHLGINAVSHMMDFLGEFTFSSEDVNEFISFYNTHIGYETDGSSLGCSMSDEVSGSLTLNAGLAEMDMKSGRITVNVRYPVSCTGDQVYDAVMPAVNSFDLGVIKKLHHRPIYRDADDLLLSTLVEVYRDHTGDRETKPLVIGGGTYARAMDNCIAFGSSFPGERDIAHQKDEYIKIDQLVTITNIFADAIYRLAMKE